MSADDNRIASRSVLQAYLLLIFATACWGANAVFSRASVGEVSPFLLVMLRWVGSVLLLWAVAHRQLIKDWPVLKQHRVFLAGMGTLGFTAFNACMYLAAHSTTAIHIGIIQGAMPMFVLVGVFVAYGTPIRPLQCVGVAVTITGVALVAVGGRVAHLSGSWVNPGDVLMVFGSVLYAGYAVGLRRHIPVSTFSLLAVMAFAAMGASIPLVLYEAATSGLLWPTPTGWLIIAAVIVFPSVLGQLSFIRGVSLIGPGRAGVFVNLVPLFASLFAVLFLQEVFSIYHAAALLLVLSGIGLSERVVPKSG